MQITLQELNMTYPNGKKALQGVSASLDSPSLIGLLGPNGAGKSTLMQVLAAEEFFIAAIKIAASFIILCQSSVALTLILFACVPLMGVVSTIINLKLRAAFRRQRVQIGELNARIEDSLLGERVVKAFANEAVEIEKFRRDNEAFKAIKKQTYRFMAAFQTSTRLFDGLMYLVVIVAGGLFLVSGRIAGAFFAAACKGKPPNFRGRARYSFFLVRKAPAAAPRSAGGATLTNSHSNEWNVTPRTAVSGAL